jgi:hypothetical protein
VILRASTYVVKIEGDSNSPQKIDSYSSIGASVDGSIWLISGRLTDVVMCGWYVIGLEATLVTN